MKKIKWIGPDRDVPGWGGFTKGQERLIEDEAADSLIRQGLAIEIETTKYVKGKPSVSKIRNKEE